MALSAALFVSNRLQRLAAAFLCLMLVQIATQAPAPEPAPYSVRVSRHR